jgi:hypothetical protein
VINVLNAPEIFAAELTAIEDMGSCVRLVFTVPRQSGTEAFRTACVYVVVPATTCRAMARLLTQKPRQISNGQSDTAYEAEETSEHKIH